MPATGTDASKDFVRELVEQARLADEIVTEDASDDETFSIEDLVDASESGWLGVDAIEVRLSDGRTFLVSAMEVWK